MVAGIVRVRMMRRINGRRLRISRKTYGKSQSRRSADLITISRVVVRVQAVSLAGVGSEFQWVTTTENVAESTTDWPARQNGTLTHSG
jgi:hypothetical protein